MNDSSDVIIARMQELNDFIIQSNEAIQCGQMTDLQGLDDEVAGLCDRTLALSPQDAVRVQPHMASMITNLEELGRTLETYKAQLENQKH